ncbi:MAG TPA: hypothetical protein VGR71_13770 [Nitrospira sp.]|nr:hypothetical protein [Nitrospira sp.]
MVERSFVRISRRGSDVEPSGRLDIRPGGKEFVFEPPEQQSAEELERERVAAGDSDWLRTVRPPEFVMELVRRGTSPSELIETLRQRAGELDDLRQAAIVLHDLAHMGHRPLVTDALGAWVLEAFRQR